MINLFAPPRRSVVPGLRERYDQVFLGMLMLATVSYVGYLLVFVALGVPHMPQLNALTAAVCAGSSFALRRGFRNAAILVTTAAVLGHATYASAVLGWAACFHLFAFVSTMFLLLNPDWRLRLKVVLGASITLGYVTVEALLHGAPIEVTEATQGIFQVLNVVMFSGSLIFLVIRYSTEMWNAASELRTLNAQLRAAETSLRQVFDLSPDAMVVSGLADPRVLDCNVQAEKLFEIPAIEAIGQPTYDFWVRAEDRAAFRAAVPASGRVVGFEAELKTRSGRAFWGELGASLIDYRGTEALLVTCSDITVRKQLAELMQDSERRLRTLLDATPMPLVVTGLNDGVIRYANSRASELFELPTDLLVGRRAPDFYVDPEDRKAFVDQLRREGYVAAFSARLKGVSGREHWMVLSARTIELHGEHLFMVGFAHIDEHKELEARLRELATTDGLTGAINRRHLFEVGDAELSRAARHGHTTTVAMLDADHFKRINDDLGHSLGDRALRMIVDVVREQVRASDTIARYGGEEFVLLFPETRREDAFQIVERMRASVAERSFAEHGTPLHVTVSVGLCQARAGEDLDAVLRRADAALYMAKNEGRNRVIAA